MRSACHTQHLMYARHPANGWRFSDKQERVSALAGLTFWENQRTHAHAGAYPTHTTNGYAVSVLGREEGAEIGAQKGKLLQTR